MFKKSIFTIFIFFISQMTFAAQSPVDMLQTTSDQMISALQKNQTKIKQDPEYVNSLAEKILLPHIDIEAMSKLALGRDNWTKATTGQRQQFENEFSNLMLRTYGTALSAYTDEEIKFRPIRGGIGDKTRVQVDSVVLQKGGPSIPVSYRLYLQGNEWKVYDMTVDGVSMVKSFRSQFSNEISRGGMSGLLQAMSKHRTIK